MSLDQGNHGQIWWSDKDGLTPKMTQVQQVRAHATFVPGSHGFAV